MFNRLVNLQYLNMEHNCLNVKYQAGEPAVSEHGTQLSECLIGWWTCSIWAWNTTVWLFNRLVNLQYLSIEHNCLNDKYQAGEPAVSEHRTQLSDCLTGWWTCSIWAWNTTVWLFNRLVNLQYMSMEHNCLNVYQAGEPAVSEHGTLLSDCLTGWWTCSIWAWNTTVWMFNRLVNLQYLSMEHNCLTV